MRPSLRLTLALILPILLLVIPTIAAPTSTITVCSLGCDYAAIQPAIDAATPGDTILIAAGIYTEQLTLKSQLTLVGIAGPTNTIVTSDNGPIVNAEHVTATQLFSLSFQSQGYVTQPVGVKITGGELTLSYCNIEGLRGQKAPDFEPGVTAYGLHVTGTRSLTLDHCAITDITGGDEADQGLVTAGDAYGLWIEAAGAVTVTDTSIQQVTGGAASGYGIYSCIGMGGQAVGIHAQADAMIVQHSNLKTINAGQPCLTAAYYCLGIPGTTSGIEISATNVILRDNILENFNGWVGNNSRPNFIIHTTHSGQVIIEDSQLTSLKFRTPPLTSNLEVPDSPYCVPPPGTFIGIASDNDDQLIVARNTLQDIQGVWHAGRAIGVQASGTQHVQLTGNTIYSLTGGSGLASWESADPQLAAVVGITIDAAVTAKITRNRIQQLLGGTVPMFGYGIDAVDGGNAIGLALNDVTDAQIDDNVIWNIVGGMGNEVLYFNGKTSQGGDAYALEISHANAAIWNNTLVKTIPGTSLSVSGTLGSAVGINLRENSTVLALNNVIAAHDIGISGTSHLTSLLGYNSLWNNLVNYVGVVSGTADLHVDPRFVDVQHGNLRLSFASPLIDTGFTPMSPADDIDGTPRPLDGNGDGVAQTDIGAYEYQPVPLNILFLPIIRRSQP